MSELKTQCYVCGQFRDDDGTWDGKQGEVIKTGNVSHGICPECFPKEMERLDREAEEYLKFLKTQPENREYTEKMDMGR